MRLSAYVQKYGIDAFTPNDFEFVGSKVTEDPSRLVLVGGQALETWGIYFDVLAPTGDAHPLTEDVDWLGSPDDATWLCNLLGRSHTELTFASAHDSTVNTAYAYLKRPDGRVLMMDFLRAIVGLRSEEVERAAVTIKVRDVTLRVLHPLLCLESRFANLEHIASKRRGNGPMQARWAIDIARAYLQRLLEQGAIADAANGCRYLAENAEYKSGRFCYLHFQLDPLAAVAAETINAIGGRFSSDEWPRTLSRIARKRLRWLDIQRVRETRRRDTPPIE